MPVLQSQIDIHSDEFQQNSDAMQACIDEFRAVEQKVIDKANESKTKIHKRGKLLPRERLRLLLDRGAPFLEICPLAGYKMHDDKDGSMAGGGVISGIGYVEGVRCLIMASNSAIKGGTISPAGLDKSLRVQEIAKENKLPIITMAESGGANLNYATDIFVQGARGFANQARLSAAGIPQVTIVHGNATAGGAYQPGLSDYNIVIKDKAKMFLAGPPLLKAATGEEVSAEDLGGASAHSTKSGVTHFSCANEIVAINNIKQLMNYIPQNCEEESPTETYDISSNEDRLKLNDIIPENPNQPYDIREVIEETVDADTFMEVHKDFAENIVVGFAKIGGKSIGIVANQPAVLAGVLDIQSSRKGGRFVRFCDSFNIPLLVFEDVPGFLPGTDQEWNGIISNGAKLLYAFCEATVPRITVITRKAYGGAYDVMNSKHIGADMNFAWPTAEIAVMGAKGAAEIIFKNEIKSAENPTEKLQEKEAEYAELFANPYNAAARGYVDEVIEPKDTRTKLIKAFRMLSNKVDTLPKKKHGNIPL